jgi:hypothetical protein
METKAYMSKASFFLDNAFCLAEPLPSPLLRTTKEKGASAKTKGKTGVCGGHTHILYRLRHKISLSKGYRI